MEVVLFYCLFLFQIELKVLGVLFLLESHRYMHVSGKKNIFHISDASCGKSWSLKVWETS